MPTMYHPTIPDVTFDATDAQVDEAREQGWLDERPEPNPDVTVEKLGGDDEQTGAGFVDRTKELTGSGKPDQQAPAAGPAPTPTPPPTGPGAAAPKHGDKNS